MSGGHSFKDVREYTVGQVTAFAKAIAKQKMEETALSASVIRAAYCADAKDFDKVLKQLNGGTQGAKPNISRVPDEWITKE